MTVDRSRWWRVIDEDGGLRAESSDEQEIRTRAQPGDRVQVLVCRTEHRWGWEDPADGGLRWWDLESPRPYCGKALVAATTIERAIELIAREVGDAIDARQAPDGIDPLTKGWHCAADELVPGVAQPSRLPGPALVEGVYFWTSN
jgi:hypothetical protein